MSLAILTAVISPQTILRLSSLLLKHDFAATAVRSPDAEGLVSLYNSAKLWFPLDFQPFVQLNISLAKANQDSAQQVRIFVDLVF